MKGSGSTIKEQDLDLRGNLHHQVYNKWFERQQSENEIVISQDA